VSGGCSPGGQSEYAGEQAPGAGERGAGDGKVDELVGVAAGVTRERYRRPSDGACDGAVLLHEDSKVHTRDRAKNGHLVKLGNGTDPVVASPGLPQRVREPRVDSGCQPCMSRRNRVILVDLQHTVRSEQTNHTTNPTGRPPCRPFLPANCQEG
jgi:hypothetical protein